MDCARILEASVRAPQDRHPDAVRAAYASGDAAWKLTAVFRMADVRGFEDRKPPENAGRCAMIRPWSRTSNRRI
jgi:hypothetical protein